MSGPRDILALDPSPKPVVSVLLKEKVIVFSKLHPLLLVQTGPTVMLDD
jgi:hypothetical protein